MYLDICDSLFSYARLSHLVQIALRQEIDTDSVLKIKIHLITLTKFWLKSVYARWYKNI